MEKEFIPYEQALALKGLGFDEPCCQAYYTNGENELSPFYSNPNVVDEWLEKLPLIKAPLYQQAFRWFREKHNMLANVYSNASGFLFEYHDTIGGTHRYDSGFTGDCEDSGTFTSFEKAELECLKQLIEIVKNK
jgi:hypothetical protein